MSSAWSRGSTTRWRRTRARVLRANQETNGGRCTLALRGCAGRADTVHHVLGRSVTGDDPRYLAAVCAACNLRVGDPTTSNPRPRRVSSW